MQPLSQRPALVEQVYERLVEAIADGSLLPGEAVTQESLAERLGVSRQPVSHALVLLRQEGLLVERGRRGLQVAPLDPDHIRDLYQVRSALDGLAAASAAARSSHLGKAERRAAETALEQGLLAVERGERAALIAADVAFHDQLNQLSGNPVIVEIAARQWPHFRRAMGAALKDPTLAERFWQEHEAILQAVFAGEEEGARRLAEAHARRAGAETWRRLREAQEAA